MANQDKKHTAKYGTGSANTTNTTGKTSKTATTAHNAEQTQNLIGEQVSKAKTALKNNIKREIVGGAVREAFAELAAGDFGDASEYLDIISDFTESIESSSLAIEAYECKGNFLLEGSSQKSESEQNEVVLLDA